jgi:hypothetical protein
MAVPGGIRRLKKAITVFSVLWTTACAGMFWSMHTSSRKMIIFFIILAGVPNVLLWGVLMIGHYTERMTERHAPVPRDKAKGSPKKNAARHT